MIFQNLDRLESTIGGDIIPQAKITFQVEVLSEFNLFIKKHLLIQWLKISLTLKIRKFLRYSTNGILAQN